jgi:hypothetical protein
MSPFNTTGRIPLLSECSQCFVSRKRRCIAIGYSLFELSKDSGVSPSGLYRPCVCSRSAQQVLPVTFARYISTEYLFINFKSNIAAQSCGHNCCHTLPIPIDDGAADFKAQTANASISVLRYDKFPMTVSHSNFYFPVLHIPNRFIQSLTIERITMAVIFTFSPFIF